MEETVVDEQFADKTAEGRESADGEGADEEYDGGAWHEFAEAAEFFHIAGVGSDVDVASAEEEECFEYGVVEGVE